MNEEYITPPEEQNQIAELAVHSEKIKPEIDINKLFLPGAILVAAVLISGTLLYINWNKLGGTDAVAASFGDKEIKKWAKSTGLKTDAFNECFDSKRYSAEIQKDFSDGSALGVTGTPAFFINGQLLVGAQPFDAFKAVIEEKLKNLGTSANVQDNDAVLGSADAPITIVEFSDYQCPFCRQFWSDTLPELKKQYIDTGKAKLIYRDFPLSFHPGAVPMALGAECADEQGKYWQFHDKAFEEQGKLGTGTIQYVN